MDGTVWAALVSLPGDLTCPQPRVAVPGSAPAISPPGQSLAGRVEQPGACGGVGERQRKRSFLWSSSALPSASPSQACQGRPGSRGLLSVASWRAPRASLTCKLASSDWLWQPRAAAPPTQRVSRGVCVCVCTPVSGAAGLEEGQLLLAFDSKGSNTRVSHTHLEKGHALAVQPLPAMNHGLRHTCGLSPL